MLIFRKAVLDDTKLYFYWANDKTVRQQSYNSGLIDFENHSKWFNAKVKDKSCLMLVFQTLNKINIGQVRIQKEEEAKSIISISIDAEYRGKGYASEMLRKASDYFLELNPDFIIEAFIKNDNVNSKYAFEKAGFEFISMINYQGFDSFHYIKNKK